MKLPLYNGVDFPNPKPEVGKGLVFNRFFGEWNNNFEKLAADTNHGSSKQNFIEQFETLENPATGYLQQFALKQMALVESLGGIWFVAQLQENAVFITGTCNPHPLENGFLWHPTLDNPYVPGSAVKGLFRSWLETELGYGAEASATPDEDRADLKRYFGSDSKSNESGKNSQVGELVFFDAIPIASPALKAEVMTPHMGQYYLNGTDKNEVGKPDAVPADWHNPIPIPMLVMSKGKFLFSVAPRSGLADDAKNTLAEEWPSLAIALQNSLRYAGVGAKTATGFGRFTVDEESKESTALVKAWRKKQKEIANKGKPKEQIILDEIAELIERWHTDRGAANDKLNSALREANKIFIDYGESYQSMLYELAESIFIPGDKGKTNKAAVKIMKAFAPGEK
ncbi:type III-B CRISPR module RAMP protein Cmr6 [Teredinibacter turnerae]|uniref:type III-B CRISPR module RAMP protein Cmr6 n=1 Tax=Teredinibacter turnerae TaxID=2426 RepID=UPI0003661FA6|nr:type III-B CRISPR module RAMP protein Cmr6 [Teredinibacter turnerae]